MKKSIKSVDPATVAIYSNLTYIIYGLKTLFNAYKLNGAHASAFKCITEFGEEINIRFWNGEWIDIDAQRQTDTSKALGAAIK